MSYFPPLNDFIDASNSTITPLSAGATFTGAAFDCTTKSICSITVVCFSDQDSDTNGMQLQWSQDNANWADHTQKVSVLTNKSGIISDKVRSKYYRVVYKNGATPQGLLRIQTIQSSTNTGGTVRDLDTLISGDDEAQLTRAVITGRSKSTSIFNEVGTDSYGAIPISFSPPVSDAFGRARVAAPQTLFDVSFQYDAQPLLMETVNVGAGTALKTTNITSVTLSTGGTTNGDGSYFQSKSYLRYEPGKSLLISMTGVIGAAKANVRSQIGFYSNNNGLFFDQNNGMNVTVRTNTSGSAVDTPVAQASWNIDKMDGSGSSGVTLDFAKEQIFIIDLQWLGAGRVRFGFLVDGQLYYCHQVLNANNLSVPYMNTACLPIRWEIHNTGTAASITTLLAGCGAVISEGGNDVSSSLTFTANNGATPISANARRPVLSIQINTTFNGFANRIKVLLKDISIMCASNSGFFELVYNGTLTGASFSAVNANSGVNFDIASTAISGGTVIESGYCPAGTLSNRAAIQKDLLNKLPFTLNAAGTTGDILTVVVSGISGAASTTAALTWLEAR